MHFSLLVFYSCPIRNVNNFTMDRRNHGLIFLKDPSLQSEFVTVLVGAEQSKALGQFL